MTTILKPGINIPILPSYINSSYENDGTHYTGTVVDWIYNEEENTIYYSCIVDYYGTKIYVELPEDEVNDYHPKENTNWDNFYFGMVDLVASKSKDRTTKVGAVIVGQNDEQLSIGYNGFPRGVDDNNESYHERPKKYLITEHAERNAIYNAARHGIRLADTKMYVTWLPCADCARAIIQSGISELICPKKNYRFIGKGLDWDKIINAGIEMLNQSDVKLRLV